MKNLIHFLKFSGVLIALLAWGLFPALVQGQITQVWPGDANENGQVNHVDLLYLGLRFGDSGPARDSVSIAWTGHDVLKWLPPMAGRPDPSHADCNGNGTVNAQDITAIETNYLFDTGVILADSTSLINASGSSPSLSFSQSSGPSIAGTRDTIFLELGSASQPVDSLLGFAATVTFDSNLVDSAYAYFGDSWLGTPGTDLVFVEDYRSGELDLAATRTDQQNVLNGDGRIGGVVIVMTENLKKEVQVDSLNFSFAQALCLTSAIHVVPVNVQNSLVPVYSSAEALEILVYPVPATQNLNIAVVRPLNTTFQGRLFNGMGALVREFTLTDQVYQLQRNGLLPGVYILEIRQADTVFRKRILFLE